MADEEVAIARLGAWLARSVGQVAEFAGGLDAQSLGYQLPDQLTQDPGVVAAAASLREAGTTLAGAADTLDAAMASGDEGQLVRAIVGLVTGVAHLIDGSEQIVDHLVASAAALPADLKASVETYVAQLPRRLVDHLVITRLEVDVPRLVFLFDLIGIVERVAIPASGAVNEPAYVAKSLHLERFAQLFQDPAGYLAGLVGWGSPTFDPGRIMQLATAFYPPNTSIELGTDAGDAYLQIGDFRWSRDSSALPPGLALDITERFSESVSERVPIDDSWGLALTAGLDAQGGIRFRLAPPFDLSAHPLAGSVGGALSFSVDRNPSALGFTIIGGNDLLRITAQNVSIGAQLTVGAASTGDIDVDAGVTAALTGMTISLGSAGSDDFLASLLASANVQGTLDLGLGWTLDKGLVVTAAGGLSIAIPMHQNLGIATLDTLYIVLTIGTDASLSLELSAGITGNLGPLTASVDRMGVELVLSFPSGSSGNLGPLDLQLRFKPPSGVGLALDAGPISGGGYLYLDPDHGEYAGALELVFQGFLELKAIGLITTKMPDGSDGFSLLIVVTAEFGTPLQLGFGFTLIGVGGLLGLNRTMMLEELAEGVRSGGIEHVMFPHDVIANAPQIIADMRRFFPPKQGTFLIGPMAKLGWGTPTLVTATLGLIIEIPLGNIAILGVLDCTLPDEDAPLLVLKVKFIGALEVDKSRLWFFASLYESRVLFITIGGELGFLLSWGDDPVFVLSVGGFHPRFDPPALPFPVPQRIELSILDEDSARIRVTAYFAVTSNTAQFGAAVELFFGVSDFNITGNLGFDALFQFSPFQFDIDFTASLSVTVFGAGLFSIGFRGLLQGPAPYHIEGEGSISFLFFSLDVPFSETWGDTTNTTNPAIEAMPLLSGELAKPANWVSRVAAGAHVSVSLRAIDPAVELVMHPFGELRVSQRAVPLDLAIDQIGSQPVSDVARLSVTVAGPGLSVLAPTRDSFATAQFRTMDAATKLSAPGYDQYASGVDITASAGDGRTDRAVMRTVRQELIVVDHLHPVRRRFVGMARGWFQRWLGRNATAQSPLSAATAAQRSPFADAVTVIAAGFAVASADSNLRGSAVVYASQAEAHDALAAHRAADPVVAAALHVIPAAELVTA